MRTKFLPAFGKLLQAGALGDQVTADKAFIDDLFVQNFTAFYHDLHAAYVHSQVVGDAMTRDIVQRFPDRFPGSLDGRDVNNRVANNLLLQEHAYVVTMATDAGAAKRDADKTAALAALASNAGKAWSDWDAGLAAYSSGAALPAPGLFVESLASVTGAPASVVGRYVNATVKVVDDQRSKSSKTLADDDRAAATATEAIADFSFQG